MAWTNGEVAALALAIAAPLVTIVVVLAVLLRRELARARSASTNKAEHADETGKDTAEIHSMMESSLVRAVKIAQKLQTSAHQVRWGCFPVVPVDYRAQVDALLEAVSSATHSAHSPRVLHAKLLSGALDNHVGSDTREWISTELFGAASNPLESFRRLSVASVPQIRAPLKFRLSHVPTFRSFPDLTALSAHGSNSSRDEKQQSEVEMDHTLTPSSANNGRLLHSQSDDSLRMSRGRSLADQVSEVGRDSLRSIELSSISLQGSISSAAHSGAPDSRQGSGVGSLFGAAGQPLTRPRKLSPLYEHLLAEEESTQRSAATSAADLTVRDSLVSMVNASPISAGQEDSASGRHNGNGVCHVGDGTDSKRTEVTSSGSSHTRDSERANGMGVDKQTAAGGDSSGDSKQEEEDAKGGVHVEDVAAGRTPSLSSLVSDEIPSVRPSLKSSASGAIRARSSLIMLEKGLVNLHSWDFDIFHFSQAQNMSDSMPLSAIGWSLFDRFNVVNALGLRRRRVFNLLEDIEAGYRDNPFHNQLHGADVAQSLSIMLYETGLYAHLEAHELMAVLIAALCHDLDHPGVNNAFLVKAEHDLSLLYNEASVLENHHASSALRLLRKPENNIFADLPVESYRAVKSLIISLILATDLKFHYDIINEFKTRAQAGNLGMRGVAADVGAVPVESYAVPIEAPKGVHRATTVKPRTKPPMAVSEKAPRRRLRTSPAARPAGDVRRLELKVKASRFAADNLLVALKMCIKCADLGHPAKAWNLHVKWTDLITQEMYDQGDLELRLGLELSPFMDRSQDHKRAASQLGFFDFLVMPMWKEYSAHFTVLQPCVEHVKENRSRWTELSNKMAAPELSSSIRRAPVQQSPSRSNDTTAAGTAATSSDEHDHDQTQHSSSSDDDNNKDNDSHDNLSAASPPRSVRAQSVPHPWGSAWSPQEQSSSSRIAVLGASTSPSTSRARTNSF